MKSLFAFQLTMSGLLRRALAVFALIVLSACSGSNKAPQPAPLATVVPTLGVKPVWNNQIGPTLFNLKLHADAGFVTVASSSGVIAKINAGTGKDVWRVQLQETIVAGVGSDGQRDAVVTERNELVVLESGVELWRKRLTANVYTAPLVISQRIFVLAADRSVTAFDAKTGALLWSEKRTGEPLILQHPGVLLAVKDTLVAGIFGRLVGLDPYTGNVRWETPIATPRGTNDVERLVDLVGRFSRHGDEVCVRAFQAMVGCVNASNGQLSWRQPAHGFEGVDGDADFIFGTESNGRVIAWSRTDGARLWSTDAFQYRGLTAPLSLGRSVIFGDSAGFVHMLARQDGSVLNRLTTDSSGVVTAPVVASQTLVIVTRSGGIYGFAPE